MSRWARCDGKLALLLNTVGAIKSRNDVFLKFVLICLDTCQTWVLLNVPKHEKGWMCSSFMK